ncbi:sporulation peptidase YabG [Thermosediminibacter oceani]|uniref:Sporulation peptidase YabG n=1 Tax=Thermosediminibacter oceani (strain ATCC BAA-1034 / DSM 16646 / JW/IW-1228P) TaxID=555079 RepID=D9RZD3_THEOJ|nr:sporulation peptidase YabG [Thermosediminibacter oceani]ADL06831.1 sporulation peptidase YabG [Thermosediminibacter oceani DSM 16646]
MAMIKVGDVVARLSYGKDIYFKVVDIREEQHIALLRGINVRIFADAPLEDLVFPSASEIREYKKEYIRKYNECLERIFYRREVEMNRLKRGDSDENGFFYIPGKVLHVDGDEEYLELCLTTYRQLGIEAHGVKLSEKDQPGKIRKLVMEYNPDILVITGHDGLLKNRSDFNNVEAYRNSKFFIEAVKEARKYEPSLDDLVIFAGACQSHYEGLIKAGANFASSPHRVFIHALDPVFVIEKIAFTPIDKIVSAKDVIEATITGIKGIGGIGTRGKLREGLPRSPYD